MASSLEVGMAGENEVSAVGAVSGLARRVVVGNGVALLFVLQYLEVMSRTVRRC